jgi:hypothetical protein
VAASTVPYQAGMLLGVWRRMDGPRGAGAGKRDARVQQALAFFENLRGAQGRVIHETAPVRIR